MALSGLIRAFKALPKLTPLLLNKSHNVGLQYTALCRNQSSSVQDKLMQFFDEKKNWADPEVRVGRSWKVDELRIKSSKDLHVLWYVLLKEKNMLLTMEEECRSEYRLFPNPERIDKVEESMKNLETVVRERNKAYHLLETGETGERPGKLTQNQLGLRMYYRCFEHVIPRIMNKKFREANVHRYGGYAASKFLRLYREKIYLEKRKERNRNFNHVVGLIKRFPNMKIENLRAEYPDVDIDRALKTKKSRGHYIPKEFQ